MMKTIFETTLGHRRHHVVTLASRRQVIAGSTFALGLALSGYADNALAQAASPQAAPPLPPARPVPPTPVCQNGDPPTKAQAEGPFYKTASPLRADLRETGMPGRPIELSGFILARSCRPVGGAFIDLWQADDSGEYDNKGFRLRGHQFADGKGHYAFRTIVPGLYQGRTRQFHVRVQAAAESPVLTTQLYFPDEPRNQDDELFRPELTLQLSSDMQQARFDIVLPMR
jgi:protocatechuate 3,4-dioxygenase beta subunit